MRWNGWYSFFTTSESAMSRDAQVYLLFQRVCIFTTTVCALISTLFLLPSYWFGGSLFQSSDNPSPPQTLLSILKSDRGMFERFTSHNLPGESPLVLLQLPVFIVVAICIVIMYSIVTTAAGEAETIDEWLYPNPNSSTSVLPSSKAYHPAQMPGETTHVPSPTSARHWTVFARGLPQNIHSADQLYSMLDVLFPSEVAGVELICKGKVSEARLLRTLSSARHRLEYLYETADEDDITPAALPRQTLVGRIFGLFARRRSRSEMITELQEKISMLEKDFESRKSEPLHDFLGCAFISLKSPDAAGSILKDFPCHLRRGNSVGSQDGLGNDSGSSTVNMAISLNRRSSINESLTVPSYFDGLCRGAVNLLPQSVRNRFNPSSSFQALPLINSGGSSSESQSSVEIRRRAEVLLQLRFMKAERAPKSGDIIWKNIGISFFERTMREMVVQVLVFTFLFLFTSPVTMLTALKLIFSELAVLTDPQGIFGGDNHNGTSSTNGTSSSVGNSSGLSFLSNLGSDSGDAMQSMSQGLIDILPSFLTSNTYLTTLILSYFPVFILASVFSLVPSLLQQTCALEGYPTRSALQMSVFRKATFYYVMNAVVLPSLALNTVSQFFEMVYNQSGGGKNVKNALPILQRLFSGDIAYFLCCYLVQLALTGSIFFLMRIPSNISMMIRRRMALTPLEAAEAKCAEIFDFPRHYAYNVTVMSMVLLFGFMAPLIWYFGLFYFLCKHCVDVYSLRYVHPRTHIDGRLPRLSSNFILLWTIISQLSLAVIFYLQGWVRAAIATVLLCILTLAGCLSISFTMGNQILAMVADLRDMAIEWVLRTVGSQYSWGEGAAVIDMSSGSSEQSLQDPQECSSLLQRGSIRRHVSDSADNCSPCLDSEAHRNDEFVGSPVGGTSGSSNDFSVRTSDGFVNDMGDDGYEGDNDEDRNYFGEDVENGPAPCSKQYGSCDASGDYN